MAGLNILKCQEKVIQVNRLNQLISNTRHLKSPIGNQ